MRAGTETRVRRRVPVVAFISLRVAGEGGGGAGEVERHHRADQPGGVRRKRVRRQMGEGGVLQVRMDLFDDGVLTVGFVGGDGIESSGSVVVKNAWNRQMSNNVPWPVVLRRSQVGDAAHHQPPGYLVALRLGGERGELDFGDLRPRDPGVGVLVVDGVGVFDRCPGTVVDRSPIARFDGRGLAHRHRHIGSGADRGTHWPDSRRTPNRPAPAPSAPHPHPHPRRCRWPLRGVDRWWPGRRLTIRAAPRGEPQDPWRSR